MTVNPPDGDIRAMLRAAHTIAVVGASQKPWRDSNSIMQLLIDVGYDVVPVNPSYPDVLGRACVPSLLAVPRRIDIVDIFRRTEAVPGVVAHAIAVGAGTIWMQSGVIHEEASETARRAGITVVMDRCIGVEYRRLLGTERRGPW